jgi:hypothetical protein
VDPVGAAGWLGAKEMRARKRVNRVSNMAATSEGRAGGNGSIAATALSCPLSVPCFGITRDICLIESLGVT